MHDNTAKLNKLFKDESEEWNWNQCPKLNTIVQDELDFTAPGRSDYGPMHLFLKKNGQIITQVLHNWD